MGFVHIKDNPVQSFEMLSKFALRDDLERPETYRAALDGVLEVLSHEDGLIQCTDETAQKEGEKE